MTILFTLIAGAIGTASRFGIISLFKQYADGKFPWPTVVVNAIGCLIAGISYAFFLKYVDQGRWNAVVIVGFLGALTTFSGYMVDTLRMIRQEQLLHAALYAGLQNIVGISCLLLGYGIFRWGSSLHGLF